MKICINFLTFCYNHANTHLYKSTQLDGTIHKVVNTPMYSYLYIFRMLALGSTLVV